MPRRTQDPDEGSYWCNISHYYGVFVFEQENKRLVGWLQNNLKEEEEKLSSEEELGQTTTKVKLFALTTIC